jgi:hypothetical protein
MTEYRVGQILYLIGNQTAKILPVQIIEEVTRTTISGKNKSYTALLPNSKGTVCDVSELKGRIFTCKNTIREYMISNAINAIDQLIDNCNNVCDKHFEVVEEVVNEPKSDAIIDIVTEANRSKIKNNKSSKNMQDNKKEDIIKVDLGNGQIAKMNLDDVPTGKTNEKNITS